jgi:hypothetical protein
MVVLSTHSYLEVSYEYVGRNLIKYSFEMSQCSFFFLHDYQSPNKNVRNIEETHQLVETVRFCDLTSRC